MRGQRWEIGEPGPLAAVNHIVPDHHLVSVAIKKEAPGRLDVSVLLQVHVLCERPINVGVNLQKGMGLIVYRVAAGKSLYDRVAKWEIGLLVQVSGGGRVQRLRPAEGLFVFQKSFWIFTLWLLLPMTCG